MNAVEASSVEPPGNASFSSRMTFAFAVRASIAAAMPAPPAPTITTSVDASGAAKAAEAKRAAKAGTARVLKVVRISLSLISNAKRAFRIERIFSERFTSTSDTPQEGGGEAQREIFDGL